MKRGFLFFAPAIISLAFATCLTAQDSILMSRCYCLSGSLIGCDKHCVAKCRNHSQRSSFLQRSTGFNRPSFDVSELCICKWLCLPSREQRGMKQLSAVNLGYHLKSYAERCVVPTASTSASSAEVVRTLMRITCKD